VGEDEIPRLNVLDLQVSMSRGGHRRAAAMGLQQRWHPAASTSMLTLVVVITCMCSHWLGANTTYTGST
jgi:hypothetical protein